MALPAAPATRSPPAPAADAATVNAGRLLILAAVVLYTLALISDASSSSIAGQPAGTWLAGGLLSQALSVGLASLRSP